MSFSKPIKDEQPPASDHVHPANIIYEDVADNPADRLYWDVSVAILNNMAQVNHTLKDINFSLVNNQEILKGKETRAHFAAGELETCLKNINLTLHQKLEKASEDIRLLVGKKANHMLGFSLFEECSTFYFTAVVIPLVCILLIVIGMGIMSTYIATRPIKVLELSEGAVEAVAKAAAGRA
ncbi:hypothetical protein QBC38DRAFT_444087 [Podospora fimiseda]|uniref:Uncharacterized protein n=1 Tax=Podospora fimiseda TaxID=252190 RepID=A0AAN7H3Y9_9PEZI|nr:hypothetical protein QBC38DRAFT_444087 [Podospora fimiseda]